MRKLLSGIVFLLLSLQIYPQVRINEFLSSNLSGLRDEDGEYSDWIELYNNSTSSINLNGYHISDDLSLLKKWTLPDISLEPSSYVLIFASGKNRSGISGTQLHANFKIDDNGETLVLTRPDSSIIETIPAVRLQADMSYGRKPDGNNALFYFSVPTPGTANIFDGYTSYIGDTVIFSPKGGYFPGGFELRFSSIYNSDSIFYTLDGSEPTRSSLRYSSPIFITQNGIVRAKSYNSEQLPGSITTNTYFTKRHSLPVVCISTDPDNLWDNNTGIYVLGPNASSEEPNYGANFWQDWEKKAHMEFYDVNGKKQIDQDIGIKIFGSWSRAFAQKSLAIFARNIYGKGSFEYQFFKDKPIKKFESLVLRNAGNDWSQAMMRDGLTSILIQDMDIDRQAFQPSVIYLNGEYWGIHNIREKINSNYLAENHSVDPDNTNILEFNGSVVEGSGSSYENLIDFVGSHTLENEQNYLQVSQEINVNNYIQYQLSEIYVNNTDWPGNNVRYWNTNDVGSLWRWILYDTDMGFSNWQESAYTFNTLAFALEENGPGYPNPPWSTLLFRRMMTNQGFRNEFANQFADRLNTNFKYEKVSEVVDSLQQIFLPEINDHLLRWDHSFDNWQNNYIQIKDYARFRPDYVRTHLRSILNLGEPLEIKIEISTPGTGKVRLNSIIPASYPFNGIYFKDLPVKLTAIPAPGYRFLRWEYGTSISDSIVLDYNMISAANIKAVFTSAGASDNKIAINEIKYSSSPDKDTKDWVELYNAGNSSLNLKNWIVSDAGPEAGYVFPADFILAPGMYIVLCRDLAAFSQFWPAVLNSTGDMNFGLSSLGDNINLYDPDGNLVDFVTFSPNAPWPTDAGVTGASIELINPELDNNMGSNWRSSINGGTPGIINIHSTTTDTIDGLPTASCSMNCYPNPFRDNTTIMVDVSVPGKYKIEVFNLMGKIVDTVTDQSIEAGEFYINWDGRNSSNSPLPGGVYIIRLSGEKHSCSARVIVLK